MPRQARCGVCGIGIGRAGRPHARAGIPITAPKFQHSAGFHRMDDAVRRQVWAVNGHAGVKSGSAGHGDQVAATASFHAGQGNRSKNV